MKDQKLPNENKQYHKLIILCCIILVIWIISGFVTYYAAENWADRGTIGDMFGGINSLFSGLAFAALIYTIFMQREEIKLNREEITMNRRELKKSTVAQISSQEALREQVKQTHLTAQINAMSTVINYYNTQIANHPNNLELIEKAKQKRRLLIHKMDELIDGLEDSNVD